MVRSVKSKTRSSKVAHVFPGQGSQEVGMGKDVYESSETARRIFSDADEALGFSLAKLCFEGPAEELNLTCNAQPAILTASVAYWEACRDKGLWKETGEPAFTAGHSMGEYTALVVAGVVDFREAVRLVWERGRAMHTAASKVPGGMAAILGLDEAAVLEICRKSGAQVSNVNCPGQVVISGTHRAIGKATRLAKERGVGKVIPLKVSGAFHSLLMEPALEELNRAIESTPFRDPEIPIIGNTTARPITSAEELREELRVQLTKCVQWQRSVEYMVNSGVATFVEVGPGRVLSGLIKRIDSNVITVGVPA